MSRPVIGRDWQGRTRTARTLEEAFGTRGGLHAGRQRHQVDLDTIIATIVFAIVAVVVTWSWL